jgi:hypothetical protein
MEDSIAKSINQTTQYLRASGKNAIAYFGYSNIRELSLYIRCLFYNVQVCSLWIKESPINE